MLQQPNSPTIVMPKSVYMSTYQSCTLSSIYIKVQHETDAKITVQVNFLQKYALAVSLNSISRPRPITFQLTMLSWAGKHFQACYLSHFSREGPWLCCPSRIISYHVQQNAIVRTEVFNPFLVVLHVNLRQVTLLFSSSNSNTWVGIIASALLISSICNYSGSAARIGFHHMTSPTLVLRPHNYNPLQTPWSSLRSWNDH